MKRHWQVLQPDSGAVEKVRRVLSCDPVTAAILVNRNIVSQEDVLSFINTSLRDIRPPFCIKGMDVAVRRIHAAIARHEKILIFGDYDVDGITATTIMVEFFRYVGADVSYYIPHRTKEGYGLQISHIEKFALPNRIKLIITVDCGSGSHDAVKAAKNAGIDIIITDHHKISRNPPQAVAVVNPKRYDCSAGFENLAGVGVAYCLLICLRKHLRDLSFWDDKPEPNLKQLCDLVALGTVADMVPLLNENRIFSKIGLDIISSGIRPGIKALIEACGIDHRHLDGHDIAFRMAPRINAAGRIDHAQMAMKLLTATNVDVAEQTARSLSTMNTRRQDIEKKMLEEIRLFLGKNPDLLQRNTLVISFHGWHEGVLGIAASRIVEKYFRPVVLISIKDGIGKGSARSIPGFDLYEGLSACSNHLEQFGGHAMAAGLKVKIENIKKFENSFETVVRKMTRPDDFLPVLSIDSELTFDDVSDRLLDELESLKPFGASNNEPLFMARGIRVISSKIVGGNHRRMLLKQVFSRTSKTLSAIHFNVGARASIEDAFDRAAFRLRWNRWNGKKTPQIVVEEV